MNKQLFIDILETAYNIYDDDPLYAGQLIELCDSYTNIGQWVDYWVHELQWGELYYDGKVMDDNNNVVPLRTAADLWDFIYSDTGGAWQIDKPFDKNN